MEMYYCPKCGKFEINFNSRERRNERTVSNCRDGWGRPIYHYLCECGNPLAGTMFIEDQNDNELVEYSKYVIEAYNEGGDFFVQGLLDYANEIKDRILNKKEG
jgi:hypothetical protein